MPVMGHHISNKNVPGGVAMIEERRIFLKEELRRRNEKEKGTRQEEQRPLSKHEAIATRPRWVGRTRAILGAAVSGEPDGGLSWTLHPLQTCYLSWCPPRCLPAMAPHSSLSPACDRGFVLRDTLGKSL